MNSYYRCYAYDKNTVGCALAPNNELQSKAMLAENPQLGKEGNPISSRWIFLCTLLILASIQFCFVPWFLWQFQSCCNIQWVIENMNCSTAQDAIIEQIHDWSFKDNCFGSYYEGCNYKLLDVSDEILVAKHTINYTARVDVQELKMLFANEGENCVIQATSALQPTMATLFAPTKGHYCALRNLVDGEEGGAIPVAESTIGRGCSERANADCMFAEKTLRPGPSMSESQRWERRCQMIMAEAAEANLFFMDSPEEMDDRPSEDYTIPSI